MSLSTLLVAACLMTSGAVPHAADTAPAALRAVMDEAVAAGYPAAIGYARQGPRQWQLAAGVADLRTGRAAEPGDRWRIFSNTKSFVSTVVLQLAGERRLGLDDEVRRWLPGVAAGVTVRQLLDHTSGVYDPTNDPSFYTDRGGVRPQEIVRVALAHPPVSPPTYSNPNYLLAGMVIEVVTRHPADLEIRRRIIEPLGLTHTSFPLDDPAIAGPHLHGYDMSYRDVTGFNPSGEWTAGGMISTVGDLARFDAALFGGRLLHPAQQRELETGLGVDSFTLPCHGRELTVWQTDGGGPGFNGVAMTAAGTSRQLVLVGNVFDLGRDQRKDGRPVPDAGAALADATAKVLCP